MKFNLQNLNNFKVKPISTGDEVEWNEKNLKSYKLFGPHKHFTCYINAKTNSGKSVLIQNIIEKTTTKKTVIWIFSPTTEIDKTWKAGIKRLTDKGYIVNTFPVIQEDGVNHLQIILDTLSEEIEEEEGEPIKPKKKKEISMNPFTKKVKMKFDNDEEDEELPLIPIDEGEYIEKKPKKQKKPKKFVPKHLFIFDDISNQLRLPIVGIFARKSRHFSANLILSAQNAKDISPATIGQISHFICFKGNSYSKLEHIHRLLDLSMDFEKWWEMYHHFTKQKYSFLYCDVRKEEYRQNFNKRILVEE